MRRERRERGLFTFVEVLLATLVLALSATATAYWVETVNNLNRGSDEQVVGASLVKVMEAILKGLPFREPGGGLFGPEPGEALARFDDLDDFTGTSFSPPLDKDRAPLADHADWTVAVSVAEADPDDWEAHGAGAGDLRVVRVTATRAGREVANTFWLRARSATE